MEGYVEINRFSVSLVYRNNLFTMIRTLITDADSESHALGETIVYFEDETKGYDLILKTVISLNHVDYKIFKKVYELPI